MAGAEFKKYVKASIGDAGHYAHYDNAVRGDPRTHHSNTHIDVTKTHLNYCIGTSGWDETRRRIDARMERADAEHPPQRIRADRVGFYSLNVKCPPELEDTEKEAEFFQKAYETACEVMPSVEGAFVHKDEKHEYTNTDTREKVISRYEMHIFGAAITDDGRLNGKDAICRDKCQEINDKMQAMCLREFGISYQTGEGRKGKKKRTVEQVEAMGVVQELTDKVQYANDTLETVQMATQEEQTEYENVCEKNRALKLENKSLHAENKELKETVESAVKICEDDFFKSADEHFAYYKRDRTKIEKDPQVYEAFSYARKMTQRTKNAWGKYRSSCTSWGRRRWAKTAIKLQQETSVAWQDAKGMAEAAKYNAALRREKNEIKKEINDLLKPHIADFKKFCKTYNALSAEKQAKYREQFEQTRRKNKSDVKDMSKHLKKLFGSKKTMDYDLIKEVQSDRRQMNKLTNKMLADIKSDASSSGDAIDIFDLLEQSKKDDHDFESAGDAIDALLSMDDDKDLDDDDFELC